MKIFFAAIALFAVAAPASSAEIPVVSPNDAFALVQSGHAVLVDVREPSEAAQGMAEPAVLMPLSQMEANSQQWQVFVAGLDASKKVIVYCRSGRRSVVVGNKLVELKFDVMNMGGFSAWEKAGLPTKKYANQ